ncbi:hypothetical protein BY458DRAFT_490702 [Sporodiniella umbellata]|nr:hypothetical protein BY458DRAFT_490702 [Sporodiniella umbellata]
MYVAVSRLKFFSFFFLIIVNVYQQLFQLSLKLLKKSDFLSISVSVNSKRFLGRLLIICPNPPYRWRSLNVNMNALSFLVQNETTLSTELHRVFSIGNPKF